MNTKLLDERILRLKRFLSTLSTDNNYFLVSQLSESVVLGYHGGLMKFVYNYLNQQVSIQLKTVIGGLLKKYGKN